MLLLVSVADAREARAAARGGADIVDAKDPRRGALGAVTARALAAIRAAVPDRPLSVALGDASDEGAVERRARRAAAHGCAYVKVGFRGAVSMARARPLARAALCPAGGEMPVVLVAYADWERADSLAPAALVDLAAAEGASAVLLDTALKDAPLFALMAPRAVGEWVDRAHAAGLTVALAGSLVARDFRRAAAVQADIVGVRGAACAGGRIGRVERARVAALSVAARRASALRAAALV